ncbi:MAG: hypothetical protein ACFB10_14135 [Salibacteraceae bacterium]
MIITKALNYHKQLNKSQKDFLATKRLSSTQSIRRWLGFMAQINKHDSLVDEAIAQCITLFWVIGVLTVVGVLLIYLTEEALWAILSLVSLLALIPVYSAKNQLQSKDLNSYLQLFFFPLLEMLMVKAGQQAKLSATVDFRIPQADIEPKTGKVRGRLLRLRRITYLTAQVKLQDGAVLTIGVAAAVKNFTWTKRSYSGKIKHKSKLKTTTQLVLKIKFPKTKYKLIKKGNFYIDAKSDSEYYIVKSKAKAKSVNESDFELPINVPFQAMEKIYQLFEDLKPEDNPKATPATDHPQNARRTNEVEDEFDDFLLPTVWMGSYFDNYDHSSFDYEATGWHVDESDEVGVFDS